MPCGVDGALAFLFNLLKGPAHICANFVSIEGLGLVLTLLRFSSSSSGRTSSCCTASVIGSSHWSSIVKKLKNERWVEWKYSVGETADKWFFYHCNEIPWLAQGCTSCSMYYMMAKWCNNCTVNTSFYGSGQSSLSPGSINSINTLHLLPGQGSECLLFHSIKLISHLWQGSTTFTLWFWGWRGWVSDSNLSVWCFFIEESVFMHVHLGFHWLGGFCLTIIMYITVFIIMHICT